MLSYLLQIATCIPCIHECITGFPISNSMNRCGRNKSPRECESTLRGGYNRESPLHETLSITLTPCKSIQWREDSHFRGTRIPFTPVKKSQPSRYVRLTVGLICATKKNESTKQTKSFIHVNMVESKVISINT